MDVREVFRFLKEDIHSTVFATTDAQGLPYVSVIDIMLYDDDALYFLTTTGKDFYNNIVERPFVAVSGMKGEDTLSTIAISLRGKLRNIGPSLIPKIFAENPYMDKIYPTKESCTTLTVFQIYEGDGEIYDLRQMPPRHEVFAFGGGKTSEAGYRITERCTNCRECLPACPSNCITEGIAHFEIAPEYCLHCGICAEICRFEAVERRY
ncbi:MAG: 4Fe-4S binding protein [Clostridiales Family XIII bacterium]|jgi:uncharacterized pyridoxamine 5'-phosphate oxidase family protein/Pyruvate/2-oxoacid:ferredoxin oxidoreductase delta subunit|nr:4Fe-4S binding protein [Clostridiales Family XIII bacterium]